MICKINHFRKSLQKTCKNKIIQFSLTDKIGLILFNYKVYTSKSKINKSKPNIDTEFNNFRDGKSVYSYIQQQNLTTKILNENSSEQTIDFGTNTFTSSTTETGSSSINSSISSIEIISFDPLGGSGEVNLVIYGSGFDDKSSKVSVEFVNFPDYSGGFITDILIPEEYVNLINDSQIKVTIIPNILPRNLYYNIQVYNENGLATSDQNFGYY